MRSAQQSADFLLLIPLRVCLVSSVPRKSPGNSSSLLSSGREACTQWRAGSRKKKKSENESVWGSKENSLWQICNLEKRGSVLGLGEWPRRKAWPIPFTSNFCSKWDSSDFCTIYLQFLMALQRIVTFSLKHLTKCIVNEQQKNLCSKLGILKAFLSDVSVLKMEPHSS